MMRHRAPGVRSVRRLAAALAAALAVLLGLSSAAASPIVGLYKSDDMDGGVFLTGRWTEGLTGLVPDPNGAGNGVHAASWDGTALATQWELVGPTLTGFTIDDHRTGGSGTVILERSFETSAATLTLKAAPWWTGPGDADYVVDLDAYHQTLTLLYLGGQMVMARSVDSFHGTVVGWPGYEVRGQGAAALVGQGDGSPPPGYPDWIPAGVLGGAWGDVGLARFQVIPEPAALLLVGLGAAFVGLVRRFRG